MTLTEAAKVRLEGEQPLRVSEGAPAERKILYVPAENHRPYEGEGGSHT